MRLYDTCKEKHNSLFTKLINTYIHTTYITLSLWSQPHKQSLAPTNPHWAAVVGYGPFYLNIVHKEGLCPSSDEEMQNVANDDNKTYALPPKG
jgi:hypothetical protein